MKKVILALFILAAISVFVAFDLGRFLTLDSLKQAKGTFAAWQSSAPWLTAAGYFGLYVVMAALSLPWAAQLITRNRDVNRMVSARMSPPTANQCRTKR